MKLALGLSFALALPAAAQRTWIVDDDAGPGVDFQQIQPAFQAANHGDIVLVRSGRYASPVAPRLDPTLRIDGDTFPGSVLTIRIEGTPGDNVRLLLGRAAIRQSVPGSPVDLLVQLDRLSPLGAIPPSGRIEFSITIPVQWTTGTLLHLQASAVEPGGQATMTGSVPLLIR